MEENINLKDLENEELLSIYKNLIEFVKELEKDIEEAKQGEDL